MFIIAVSTMMIIIAIAVVLVIAIPDRQVGQSLRLTIKIKTKSEK